MKRSNYLKSLLIAAAALFMLPVSAQTVEHHGSDDFKIGIAGYCFRKFNIDQALEMMKEAGVKYMSIKNFHLPYDSTAEEMAAFKQKLESYGVDGYILGPIYMKTPEEVDQAFEYVKRYGHKLFIGVPTYELLDYTEQKVKEYNIAIAIHTHGPDNQPFPDAADVMAHVKDRDPRIGICLDLGHTIRYGGNCAADIYLYPERIFDIHFKDVTAPEKVGTTWEMGRGVMDYAPIVKALRNVGYQGVCSLEFEKAPDNPYPGMRESLGYFRAVCDIVK